MWCIPKITPEYRERMYDVLDLYQQLYDPRKPVIGVDEKPKQLIEDSRPPIPMQPGKPEKYDYEYVRNGNSNIFMAVEPKHGKRTTKVTWQRTNIDFAQFMKELVLFYPYAEKLRIVLDNLSTHSKKAFHDAFEKEEAERILSKLEFHYTPKHASWLNVAEIEIGVMDNECTDRRMKNLSYLKSEVEAWNKRRNKERRKIDWRFTKEKADEKLSKYYIFDKD
jgi:hypothetical protein|tara:strand:+ start:506 stop:1171 length:666 start_codon:yes stop_codon:yes gene_type:complete